VEEELAAGDEAPAAETSSEGGSRSKLLRLAIRLVAPILLVLVIWKLGEPRRLLAALTGATLLPLGAALLLNAPVNHLRILRWRALLKRRGYDYSVRRCWTAVLPSLYLGAVTPGRVGDVLRIQYLSHDLRTPYAEGLAVTVMDRVCDLYVLAAFVAVGIAHFASVLHGELAILTWAAVAVATLAPLSLLIPGLAEKLMGRIYQRIAKGRAAGGLERFLTALRAQVSGVLVYAVAMSVLAFLITYTQGWLIGRAIGLEIGFVDVMGLMAITSLLSFMPISLSGLGVRELFMAVAFPYLGWSAEEGIAFGLLIFASIFLVNVVVGFTAWQIKPPPFDLTRALDPPDPAEPPPSAS
jgi:uncharacterized protein (TIRG00374 family)